MLPDSANPPSVPTLDVEATANAISYSIKSLAHEGKELNRLSGTFGELLALKRHLDALESVSVFLRDELTELRKDRERLNLVEPLSRPRVDTRPRSSFSQGDVSWDGRTFTWTAPGPAMYSTLRAAIDSVARSVHPSETDHAE